MNILDLVLVAGRFGQSGQNSADVNGDGGCEHPRFVLVAGAFGTRRLARLCGIATWRSLLQERM